MTPLTQRFSVARTRTESVWRERPNPRPVPGGTIQRCPLPVIVTAFLARMCEPFHTGSFFSVNGSKRDTGLAPAGSLGRAESTTTQSPTFPARLIVVSCSSERRPNKIGVRNSPARLDPAAEQTAATTLPRAIEVKAIADCTVEDRTQTNNNPDRGSACGAAAHRR